ncbi:MAG: hypothetical protein JXA73_21475 [Acidobacteria bacterium]|nr:hypothetical protein [Acidobacteriota bacterium]
MDESKDGLPAPFTGNDISESNVQQTMKPEIAEGDAGAKPIEGSEKLFLEIDRFSGLSSEMIALLSNLYRHINQSAEEFQSVRSALNLEREEIAALRKAERSAADLQQQIEEIRQQKESLDGLISTQRNAWEAEKARRAREEKEYYENRQNQREREEEEHRKAWDAERLKARQMLEEELNAARQRNREAQEAAERDFLNRELTLKKKEQEWSQLIQELEQFLSRLAKRARPGGAASAQPRMEDSGARLSMPVSGDTSTGSSRAAADAHDMEDQSGTRSNTDEVLMWENAWDVKDPILEDKPIVFGMDSAEESGDLPSSERDLQILHGRKPEDQSEESQAKRDCVPLKFSPRNSNSHKPEE